MRITRIGGPTTRIEWEGWSILHPAGGEPDWAMIALRFRSDTRR